MTAATTRVAFLRAVNLGKRRVEMSRLATVARDRGYTGVWTYINSGNLVFDASGSRQELEKDLEAALESEFGFECTTFVRTGKELAAAVEHAPFEMTPGDTHFVTFLKSTPTATQARRLEALSGDYDTLIVSGRDVHWHMRGRSSASPLTKRDWERILGVNSSTSRNTTMLTKLAAKLKA